MLEESPLTHVAFRISALSSVRLLPKCPHLLIELGQRIPGPMSWCTELKEDGLEQQNVTFHSRIQLPDPSHGTDAGGACVYLQVGAVKLGRCEEALFCICEKMKKPVRKN